MSFLERVNKILFNTNEHLTTPNSSENEEYTGGIVSQEDDGPKTDGFDKKPDSPPATPDKKPDSPPATPEKPAIVADLKTLPTTITGSVELAKIKKDAIDVFKEENDNYFSLMENEDFKDLYTKDDDFKKVIDTLLEQKRIEINNRATYDMVGGTGKKDRENSLNNLILFQETINIRREADKMYDNPEASTLTPEQEYTLFLADFATMPKSDQKEYLKAQKEAFKNLQEEFKKGTVTDVTQKDLLGYETLIADLKEAMNDKSKILRKHVLLTLGYPTTSNTSFMVLEKLNNATSQLEGAKSPNDCKEVLDEINEDLKKLPKKVRIKYFEKLEKDKKISGAVKELGIEGYGGWLSREMEKNMAYNNDRHQEDYRRNKAEAREAYSHYIDWGKRNSLNSGFFGGNQGGSSRMKPPRVLARMLRHVDTGHNRSRAEVKNGCK